jgi:hypothetical protein
MPLFVAVDLDVGGDDIDLFRDELGVDLERLFHAERVLRGNRGDRRHAVDVEHGERFQIHLNASPARRIGAGDGERGFHDRYVIARGRDSQTSRYAGE